MVMQIPMRAFCTMSEAATQTKDDESSTYLAVDVAVVQLAVESNEKWIVVHQSRDVLCRRPSLLLVKLLGQFSPDHVVYVLQLVHVLLCKLLLEVLKELDDANEGGQQLGQEMRGRKMRGRLPK
jgi:hypothetical protein